MRNELMKLSKAELVELILKISARSFVKKDDIIYWINLVKLNTIDEKIVENISEGDRIIEALNTISKTERSLANDNFLELMILREKNDIKYNKLQKERDKIEKATFGY